MGQVFKNSKSQYFTDFPKHLLLVLETNRVIKLLNEYLYIDRNTFEIAARNFSFIDLIKLVIKSVRLVLQLGKISKIS